MNLMEWIRAAMLWIVPLGVIVAIIVGSIQIWKYFKSPKPKLSAVVRCFPFKLSQALADEFRNISVLKHLIYTYSIHFQAPTTNLKDKLADMFTDLFKCLKGFKHLPDCDDFYDVWWAEVMNKGSKTCESVVLRLPLAELALIERQGIENQVIEVEGIIELNNLAPLDKVSVTAWARGIGISESELKEVRLSFKEGIGKVKVKTKEKDLSDG